MYKKIGEADDVDLENIVVQKNYGFEVWQHDDVEIKERGVYKGEDNQGTYYLVVVHRTEYMDHIPRTRYGDDLIAFIVEETPQGS